MSPGFVMVDETTVAGIKARSALRPEAILVSERFGDRRPRRVFARYGRGYLLGSKAAEIAVALLSSMDGVATWDDLYRAAYGDDPAYRPASRTAIDFPLKDARMVLERMGVVIKARHAVGMAVCAAAEISQRAGIA